MSAGDIFVKWDSGERRFGPERTVTIGRDPDCDVVVDDPRVSRRHAELRAGADGWDFVDTSSSRGSFVNGAKVQHHALDRTTSLTLGGSNGLTIQIVVPERTSFGAPPAPTDGPSATPPAAPPVSPPTPPPAPAPFVSPAAASAGSAETRPGGTLREEPVAATVVTGSSINVQCSGQTHTFQPGKEIIIGRDPSADVHVDNPVVSRRHASIRSTGTGWEIADHGSSTGTFIDGERVTTARLSGSVAVYLGPEDVGERMVVVTSGPTTPSHRRRSGGRRGGAGILVVAIVALVALVAAVALVAVVRNSGSSGPDNNKLARASVFVDAGAGTGSGTIIDAEQGLILTNAHVAAPSALGQGVIYDDIAPQLPANPTEVGISISDGVDRAAEPKYRAVVKAVDGYLDLAVLKITKTSAGALIGPDDLEGLTELRIDKADSFSSGDPVRIIGYPGVSESKAPTITAGVISGGVQDDRLSSNRGWVNVDANFNPGNSGGSAVDDDGRLIGVPTQTFYRDATDKSISAKRIRPAEFAQPLIDAVKANTPYTTTFVKDEGDAKVTRARFAQPSNQEPFVMGCSDATAGRPSPGAEQVAVALDYDGFPAEGHQDALVALLKVTDDGLTIVGRSTTAPQFSFAWDTKGCVVVQIPLVEALGATDTYRVGVFVGGNYEVVDSPTLALP